VSVVDLHIDKQPEPICFEGGVSLYKKRAGSGRNGSNGVTGGRNTTAPQKK